MVEAVQAVRAHWPEYLIEGALLGLFMVSAGLFATLLESPSSPLRQAIDDPWLRRLAMGLAMGATAMALIYSPWGKRSGAHFNPATTLTFWRLGKVKFWDAMFYPLAQAGGGVLGVLVVLGVLGESFAAPPVSFVATVPGMAGLWLAFLAEASLAFVLILLVLSVSNTPKLAPYIGVMVGCLVALFITVEAPVSGMSINPARSLASALPSGLWTGFWIYLVAPVLGMLFAAEVHLALKHAPRVMCAKLDHRGNYPCIFNCGYHVAADDQGQTRDPGHDHGRDQGMAAARGGNAQG